MTVCLITIDDGHFYGGFWAFSACSCSLIQYIRPIININVAHLSRKYVSVLMITTTIDRPNKLFPIAFEVEEIEGRVSCEYFCFS